MSMSYFLLITLLKAGGGASQSTNLQWQKLVIIIPDVKVSIFAGKHRKLSSFCLSPTWKVSLGTFIFYGNEVDKMEKKIILGIESLKFSCSQAFH